MTPQRKVYTNERAGSLNEMSSLTGKKGGGPSEHHSYTKKKKNRKHFFNTALHAVFSPFPVTRLLRSGQHVYIYSFCIQYRTNLHSDEGVGREGWKKRVLDGTLPHMESQASRKWASGCQTVIFFKPNTWVVGPGMGCWIWRTPLHIFEEEE